MGFGFDEAGETKSMTLVDLDGAGAVTVQELPLVSKRPLQILTGRLEELLAAGRIPGAASVGSLIKAVLTDEGALIDAIGQLRAVYPNVLQLERQNRLSAIGPGAAAAIVDRRDPPRVISSFLDAVRGRAPDEVEVAMIAEALADAVDEAA
jgi:exonuclease SbcD